MSRAGDVAENPVTGERVVVRVGTEDSGGELLVVELFVGPGVAVAGEHVHPTIDEWFTVLEGRVGFRLDGRESIAPVGERLHVPPGTAHDWWNAGGEEARVIIEVNPAARFEEAVSNTFGLARDGKTNAKGMPNLLQVALFAREFEDVLYFTSPPPPCRGPCSPSSPRRPGSSATRAATPSTWANRPPRGSRSSRGRGEGRGVRTPDPVRKWRARPLG